MSSPPPRTGLQSALAWLWKITGHQVIGGLVTAGNPRRDRPPLRHERQRQRSSSRRGSRQCTSEYDLLEQHNDPRYDATDRARTTVPGSHRGGSHRRPGARRNWPAAVDRGGLWVPVIARGVNRLPGIRVARRRPSPVPGCA